MMAALPNSPFRPGFGSSPPVLAGRADLIADFADGLTDGPGSSARVSFYTGSRGVGKTVLLNALENSAREQGWVIVAETCTPGLVSRLVENRLPTLYEGIADSPPRRRTTGVSIAAVGGVTWKNTPENVRDLRAWVDAITDALAERDSGLLLTIDEIHPRHMSELVEVASVVQHAIREERQVAFAGAALSSSREGILKGDSTTFLRRADWRELGRIPDAEAARAIREPIEGAHRQVTDAAVDAASDAAQGYAFLVQLLGDLMWKNRPTEAVITAEDVIEVVPKASRRMGANILGPDLEGLSQIDRTYLLAMALEEVPRSTGRIASRMGVDPGFANVYRQRLIGAGVIRANGYGNVEFVTPGMDRYILERTDITELPLPLPPSADPPSPPTTATSGGMSGTS